MWKRYEARLRRAWLHPGLGANDGDTTLQGLSQKWRLISFGLFRGFWS